MDIITTHVRTDFDGLAAMVAASALYPEAVRVIPGTPGDLVRKFLNLHRDLFRVKTPGEVELERCTRLIIVDASRADRLGPLAAVAERDDVKLHIYDHHPVDERTLAAEVRVIEPVGAATTLLWERIPPRARPTDALTVTLLALGIYQDTGSLTYPSTTSRDVRAVADLIDRGARLGVIAEYLSDTLKPEQHELLLQLSAALRTVEVGGVSAGVSWAETSVYTDGLAQVLQRLIELAALDVAAIVVGMSGKLFIVSRSRLPSFSASEWLASWGGKGHHGAASAVMRQQPIDQVASELLARLDGLIRPQATAADIMTWPVHTTTADATVDEASSALQIYGHTGLPVLGEDGQLIGIISRRDLDKARRHGLGHAPVAGFMSRNVITTSPDAGIDELRELMAAENKGRLPVVEDGRLVGIVTRTDVLRQLYGVGTRARGISPDRQRNVRRLMYGLPSEVQLVLETASVTAKRRGVRAWVVGGLVRDLLLGLTNWDIDLVIGADGPGFARAMAAELDGRVRCHPEFSTATVELPDGRSIDVATARREYYDHIAALPRVEGGELRDDLARRDFTINAMAVDLTEESYGQLIDLFGGRRDLLSGAIRVLHNLSFIDDPTRIFRMVRFEQRLSMRADEETERFARHAVATGALDQLSPERYSAELMLTAAEVKPGDCWVRLGDLGAVPGLEPERMRHGAARVEEALEQCVPYLVAHGPDQRLVWLGALLLAVDEQARRRLSERLVLMRKGTELVRSLDRFDELLTELGQREMQPSDVAQFLQRLPAELMLLLYATGDEAVRGRLDEYFVTLERVEIHVTGHDLKAAGYRPGPLFGETLSALSEAALDQGLHDRSSQLEFALSYIDRRSRVQADDH